MKQDVPVQAVYVWGCVVPSTYDEQIMYQKRVVHLAQHGTWDVAGAVQAYENGHVLKWLPVACATAKPGYELPKVVAGVACKASIVLCSRPT